MRSTPFQDTRSARIAGALAIAAFAVLASAAPAVFQVDRAAILNGELWRLWTGHFVHASHDHLVYDIGAAVILTMALGEPRRWALGFVWMAPTLSVILLTALPTLDVYYGLSALLHAWVVIVAAETWRRGHGTIAGLGALISVGTLLKAGWETTQGSAPLTSSLDMGGPVVYASHLVGALMGALVGALMEAGRILTRRASAGDGTDP